jgi:phosphoglycerate dehydrogenase-like enzyme
MDPVRVLITIPFPEDLVEQLRRVSPRLEINSLPAHRPEDISPDTWEHIEVLYTDRILPDPTQVPNLRWVQFHFAGIEFALESPLLKKKEIQATTLSGAAAPQMAEFALAMMLALGRRLPALFENQKDAGWPRDRWERFSPQELRNSTVGILGYGSIGREIARILQPFRLTILAIKRDVMHPQDTGYIQPGLGDPEGNLFRRLYPPEAIGSMLKECDFVIDVLPYSKDTVNLIGEKELAQMKPSAFLISLGRGGTVNINALVSALQERRIAGAALDVFTEEPLPPGSPLWHLPNVIITPHIGGMSTRYYQRAIDLFASNLARYLEGAPLYNRFDPDHGY